MPRTPTSRDRFDDLPEGIDRVGAHRAENPRMRGWLVFIWALVATVVLTVVGIFASMMISGRIDLFPTADPTVSQSAGVEPVVDASYTVLVLNATDETGLGTAVRDEIIAADVGWTGDTVLAANAASTDFEQTTVYYAYPEDEAAAMGLAQLLGDVPVVQSDAYLQTEQSEDGSQTRQLTVVVGADRATTGEEAPAS
ncbi:hypothetical protein FHX49_000559 [Microbacterium endophyticum]|uniref:LytR/CpsA/Psr regulator C-terminal domain-containing protein n=1 Tax=Microbacterium endophyticum TaxID=1526412 RepID=A0A7W4V2M2_9MICO|nr:LytR C-terminal domain-containing protein [Microbacterium endophyticum]MBB2975018.1 hypothetical protein [Microbacterium endophyticum]NIK37442.1 hypothetical protein [Microbacterium endophyticum]